MFAHLIIHALEIPRLDPSRAQTANSLPSAAIAAQLGQSFSQKLLYFFGLHLNAVFYVFDIGIDGLFNAHLRHYQLNLVRQGTLSMATSPVFIVDSRFSLGYRPFCDRTRPKVCVHKECLVIDFVRLLLLTSVL